MDALAEARIFELTAVLREVRRLVALPDNNFAWSSWVDADDALGEIDRALALLERGELPAGTLRVFFAPTGPLQETALSSGWGDEFCALADLYDLAAGPSTKSSARVVSLLPSATEMVVWLGASENLVGISHECDYPESIRSRPVLTRSRIDPAASSIEIDRAVREVLGGALSIYSVDEQKLAELSPDIIITQDLCKVCAVSLDDLQSAVARLSHRENVKILSLRPTRFVHMLDDLEHVARALGLAADGHMLRNFFESRIERISRRARDLTTKPRVVTIEWLDPRMLGGLWMPELIELAGGRSLGARAGEPAPTVTTAELAALDPEIVVLKPCGFTLARTFEELKLIDAQIAQIVPNAKIYIADGNAYFNRPGPRLLDSLEILAACIHPTEFADLVAKHKGAFVELNIR